MLLDVVMSNSDSFESVASDHQTGVPAATNCVNTAIATALPWTLPASDHATENDNVQPGICGRALPELQSQHLEAGWRSGPRAEQP